MAATKKTVNTFNISFRISVDVGMEISGATLEHAIEQARAMKVTDVLDLSDLDHNDSNIALTGVFEIGLGAL